MVSIDNDLSEMKIAAEYESAIINKDNFYEFDFTKFDDLSWTRSFPDLKEKVLFQIRLTNDTSGTFVLNMEEAKRVGDWLWNVAIGANETEEFRKLAAEMFENEDENKDKSADDDFNFPTHFHRYVPSKFEMTDEQQAAWDAAELQERELGASYRRMIPGWNVLIPVNKNIAQEMLSKFEKTALPVEEVYSITLEVKS